MFLVRTLGGGLGGIRRKFIIIEHVVTAPVSLSPTFADLGGGLRGLQPPLVGKFYQKRSILAIFRASTPISGPNSGQK